MAYISQKKRKNGTAHYVVYYVKKQRKEAFFNAKVPVNIVKQAALAIDEVVRVVEYGLTPSPSLQAYLDTLPPNIRKIFESAGLILRRDNDPSEITVEMLLARYRDEVTDDRKDATIRNIEQSCAKLTAFFNKDEKAADVNEDRARDCRLWMLDTLAKPTVSKHITRFRAIWAWAKKRELVTVNPWLAVRKDPQTNAAKKFFVSVEDYNRLLDACPNQSWRTRLALCRIGGLRIDEARRLKWSDVLWDLAGFTSALLRQNIVRARESDLCRYFRSLQ